MLFKIRDASGERHLAWHLAGIQACDSFRQGWCFEWQFPSRKLQVHILACAEIFQNDFAKPWRLFCFFNVKKMHQEKIILQVISLWKTNRYGTLKVAINFCYFTVSDNIVFLQNRICQFWWNQPERSLQTLIQIWWGNEEFLNGSGHPYRALYLTSYLLNVQ